MAIPFHKMAYVAVSFLAETEVIPLRLSWPASAGSSNLIVIWSAEQQRLQAVTIESGEFSVPFVLTPENWGHGNLLPTNISIYTPNKALIERLVTPGTLSEEQRQLLQRTSHLTAMKAALTAFFKEVSRSAKEGGDMGMEELEAIWQNAKSEVEADEAKLEIRRQKEDLAAFMETCAAQFSNVHQQEAADTAMTQSFMAQIEAQMAQLREQMATLMANTSYPPAGNPSLPTQPFMGNVQPPVFLS